MSGTALASLADMLAPALGAMLAVGVALAIDRRLGEPPNWAHPVVAMGRYLGRLGPALLRLSAAQALVGGTLAWCLGALLVLALALAADMVIDVVAWCLRREVGALMASAGMLNPPSSSLTGMAQALAVSPLEAVCRGCLLGIVLKPMLAWRMLHDEVAGVEQALAQSLEAGRARLQRLVSRDVAALDEAAVRESAIESLAENLNDSVVAPLFWFAVAGLPGAALYRFANTADAMWGYRGAYEWAGKWAARADDALSWLPARLTAFLLWAVARRWPDVRLMRAQAALTPSPNGGWPMGSMACLLGVCLGKPGVYALNAQAGSPQARHTAQALRWAGRVVQAAAWSSVAGMALWAWLMAGGVKA